MFKNNLFDINYLKKYLFIALCLLKEQEKLVNEFRTCFGNFIKTKTKSTFKTIYVIIHTIITKYELVCKKKNYTYINYTHIIIHIN